MRMARRGEDWRMKKRAMKRKGEEEAAFEQQGSWKSKMMRKRARRPRAMNKKMNKMRTRAMNKKMNKKSRKPMPMRMARRGEDWRMKKRAMKRKGEEEAAFEQQ